MNKDLRGLFLWISSSPLGAVFFIYSEQIDYLTPTLSSETITIKKNYRHCYNIPGKDLILKNHHNQ